MKRMALIALALFLLPSLVEAESFPRDALGIFSSDDNQTLLRNNLRADVEMPLNHLGLNLLYHDIAYGLPADKDMVRFRAIIVWFESSRIRHAEEFWKWLARQMDQGRRVVLLGGASPRVDLETQRAVPLEAINKTLSRLGIRAGNDYSVLPFDIAIVKKNSSLVEFERKLDFEADYFALVQSIDSRNQVYLTLKKKSTGTLAHAVVISPGGGFVLPKYTRHMDPVTFKRQWRINPFVFFSRALGVDRTPRPDCTTLNGSRIFFSHVDGDGMPSMSHVAKGKNNGQALYEHVLKKFPYLPVSVSVIGMDINKHYGARQENIDAARRIFKLPYVEAASHTYTHPLFWQRQPEDKDKDKALRNLDVRKEVLESARLIETTVLPKEKKCRMIFWSGNCDPAENAMAVSQDNGLLNINGGDTRMDPVYPSYTSVAPLYRKVGPYYQIHTGASNENLYTHLWRGPFGGFKNVILTFKNTETPRRVAPINVYYHFYSAEREASLNALITVLKWVSGQKTFPVQTSRYINIVNGFISARITRLSQTSWRISDNGALRTVRFDFTDMTPDMRKSRGLLGYRAYQGSLYIFLDEQSRHDIVLSSKPQNRLHLHRSTADVEALASNNQGGWTFHTYTSGGAEYEWRGLPDKARYEITITDSRSRKQVIRAQAAKGALVFAPDLTGKARVTVTRTAGGATQ